MGLLLLVWFGGIGAGGTVVSVTDTIDAGAVDRGGGRGRETTPDIGPLDSKEDKGGLLMWFVLGLALSLLILLV